MLDIFTNDAFGVIEMTEAVNHIPNQWGRIGELGLFVPKPIRTTLFSVEAKNGVLQLIQSSQRGTALPGARRGRRDLRAFQVSRFGLQDRIIADDVQGLRAVGTSDVLAQVEDIVLDRQVELRGSVDITREYLRAGALQGLVKDADGSVLCDVFDTFGITQKVVDFTLGSSGASIEAAISEVTRHIRTNLQGDVMTGVGALCTPTYWDKLMRNEDFRDAHRYYSSIADPLREDVSSGFKWKGVVWEEYLAEGDVPQEDGSTVTQSFIPDGDVRFFPTGTRQTFREYNAPADYLETVNTPGQPFYSMLDVKKRWVDVEVQMNTLPLSVRPAVLVRGHSSN